MAYREYVGEVNDNNKSDFLGRAKALLFPIDWPEPFGLVMIEAEACGTPVIASPSGSVPEIVSDSKTGFIVRDDLEAADDQDADRKRHAAQGHGIEGVAEEVEDDDRREDRQRDRDQDDQGRAP